MLATASLGAVWASCSPDFGAKAIADRLLQIEPKLILWESAYCYNGRLHSLAKTTRAVMAELSRETLHVVIKVDELDDAPLPGGAVASSDWLGNVASTSARVFIRTVFIRTVTFRTDALQ